LEETTIYLKPFECADKLVTVIQYFINHTISLSQLLDLVNTNDFDIASLLANFTTLIDFCALIDLFEYLNVDKGFLLIMRFHILNYASSNMIVFEEEQLSQALKLFGQDIVNRTLDYTCYNDYPISGSIVIDEHDKTCFINQVDLYDQWYQGEDGDSVFSSAMPDLLQKTKYTSRVIFQLYYSDIKERQIDWDRIESVLVLCPNVTDMQIILVPDVCETFPLKNIQDLLNMEPIKNKRRNEMVTGCKHPRLEFIPTSQFSALVHLDREKYAREIFIIRLHDYAIGTTFSFYGTHNTSSCWIDFDKERNYDLRIVLSGPSYKKPNRFYNMRCDYQQLYKALYQLLVVEQLSPGSVPFDITIWPTKYYYDTTYNPETSTLLQEIPILSIGLVTLYFEPYPLDSCTLSVEKDKSLVEKFLSLKTNCPINYEECNEQQEKQVENNDNVNLID